MKVAGNHNMDIKTVSGGDFMFFGVLNGLNNILVANKESFVDIQSIDLAFNVDGVPLFHSSSYSL